MLGSTTPELPSNWMWAQRTSCLPTIRAQVPKGSLLLWTPREIRLTFQPQRSPSTGQAVTWITGDPVDGSVLEKPVVSGIQENFSQKIFTGTP